jgi:hypothetical protein
LGDAAGVMLDRVSLLGDSRKFTLLFVQGARGESAAPILVQNSSFQSPTMCLVAEASSLTEPTAHLHLLGNRFSGGGTHIQLNVAGRDLRVAGNIFENCFALIVDLRPMSKSSEIVIANNTFFRSRGWLNLRSTSGELPESVIANNLILENGISTIDADSPLAEFASNWTVTGNHWEISTSTFDEAIRGIAEIHKTVDVVSREASSTGYLRLAHPLPPAQLPDLKLAPYVGALPLTVATHATLP